MTRRATTVLLVTCAWTLFVWVVGIKNFVIGGNHTTGFRVVHTVLAVISIALGLAVGMIGWRARAALRRDAQGANTWTTPAGAGPLTDR